MARSLTFGCYKFVERILLRAGARLRPLYFTGLLGGPRSCMQILPDWLKNGYLRLMEPIADFLVRRRVHPNTITIWGTIFTVGGGVVYGTGHIMTGGWFLGITALTDVLDGMVARRGNQSSAFGAFLDSSLDRVADGAVLGG